MKPKSPLSPLYSRYLSSDEKRSLRQVRVDNLSSEINLLRVLNSFFMEIQESAPQDLDSRMQALCTCVMMSEQLACLIRTQMLNHAPGSDFMDQVYAVLAEPWRDRKEIDL